MIAALPKRVQKALGLTVAAVAESGEGAEGANAGAVEIPEAGDAAVENSAGAGDGPVERVGEQPGAVTDEPAIQP